MIEISGNFKLPKGLRFLQQLNGFTGLFVADWFGMDVRVICEIAVYSLPRLGSAEFGHAGVEAWLLVFKKITITTDLETDRRSRPRLRLSRYGEDLKPWDNLTEDVPKDWLRLRFHIVHGNQRLHFVGSVITGPHPTYSDIGIEPARSGPTIPKWSLLYMPHSRSALKELHIQYPHALPQSES